MPIIALILSSLVFWTFYWFIRMGGVDHLRAKRAQRQEAERLAKARASHRSAPLRAIDDPRDAAVILMLVIARENGDPTREHMAKIETIAHATFGFDPDIVGRMTQARFLAGRADSFSQAAALFSDLFNKRLTGEEKQDLLRMLEE